MPNKSTSKKKGVSSDRAHTINNFNISHARSIAKRHFEEDVYEVLLGNNEFILRLSSCVDAEELRKFQKRYPEFNIILMASMPYTNNQHNSNG